MSANKPVIGVTTARRGGRWMWYFNRFNIWRSGGRARRIRPQRPSHIDELDGLLVGGGDDIGVELYDMVPEPTVEVDRERDVLEMSLVTEAHERGIPVLGVCRGAQMINVAFGGNLHTDIYEVYVKAPRLKTVLPKKKIHVDPDSRLARLMGREDPTVNALHHQSIDGLGKKLKAVAHDQAGIVQGIESEDPETFLFGVQWHPEFLIFHPHQLDLFRALVEAAKRFAARRTSGG